MTEPSQKALDYAARKAGYDNFRGVQYLEYHTTHKSIIAHARTLDELWAIKPPKTRGELFVEEMGRRGRGNYRSDRDIIVEMIAEGWEPKDD